MSVVRVHPRRPIFEVAMNFWRCKNISQVKDFCRYIESEWDFSKPLRIDWKEYKPERSLDQNALFHVWCRQMAKFFTDNSEHDYPEEWVKTRMKRKFGIIDSLPDPQSGELIPSLRSTKGYTQGEMFHFMQAIDAYAAEMGIILTVQGEYEELKNG